MLSYTLDGQKTDIKPTKESGYIANKISCENGSNLIWDNTNWEVEIIKLESNDICTIDFTTNTSTSGYRVTATTNVEGSIDSLSKATIENGKVIFYLTEGYVTKSISGCNGVVENNKFIVNSVTSNQTCSIIVAKTLYATLSDEKKYEIETRPDFNTQFGGRYFTEGYNQTGKIYLSENNYYFAGNPSDNWIKMEKSDGTELWWRIIRTNSKEGTRLLYAGTSHDGQDGYINNKTYVWNGSYNFKSDVEWNNASFKSDLIEWYNYNITSENDLMIETIVYCNDTSYKEQSWGNSFGPYNRLYIGNTPKPSYSCETNGFGNAAKIGLMTADEVAYAGGCYNTPSPNTYYYRNSKSGAYGGETECRVTGGNNWITMSPSTYSAGYANMFYIKGGNYTEEGAALSESLTSNWFVVRPVITLKSEVLVSGSGTTDDPFIPSLAN